MDEKERIVEVEREPVVERHTTVVSTGDGGGGGGTVIAVLVLIVALIVLFLLFGRGLIGGAADKVDEVDVKVEVPSAPSK